MKTITFYSYKGGVGRSLALSNIAIRLSELNKKVCVVDFDLDAPGLRFKFTDYSPSKPIDKGLVDYIFEYSEKGRIPINLQEYVTELTPNNISLESIHFISAGNIESDEYWKKLSMIRWADMFYSEKAQGIRFFLDMKAKIEKEINPDFLLIDSRTGITDISGITLRLFADEIVVLAVNNKENIFGSKKIIKSLTSQVNPLFKKVPKVTFVLTRLPYTDTPKDKEKEFDLIQSRKKEFQEELELEDFEISVIHSDRRLEEKETPLIGISYDNTVTSISNDYLKLFDHLTADVLGDETEKFKNIKHGEIEFSKAWTETDLAKKLIHLNRAIGFNSHNAFYFYERGGTNWNLQNYKAAMADFAECLRLNPQNVGAKYSLGILNIRYKNYPEALSYLDSITEQVPTASVFKSMILVEQGKVADAEKLLDESIQKYPEIHQILNARADVSRRLKKFERAYNDIYKAIELEPDQPLYFGTLAEISADANNIENFYLNLTIALSKGIAAEQLTGAKEVYTRFKEEKRFLELMKKYQIRVEDIFKPLEENDTSAI